MNRSDYMASGETAKDAQLKQVEFNTMASGAGSLSQRICSLHKSAPMRLLEQCAPVLHLFFRFLLGRLNDGDALKKVCFIYFESVFNCNKIDAIINFHRSPRIRQATAWPRLCSTLGLCTIRNRKPFTRIYSSSN